MKWRTVWVTALVLAIGVLVWASSQLAALRIYQVDECQNLYMASVLAKGLASTFFTNASLFLLGPLSWITQNAAKAADAFQQARLVFLGVFWLNLFLMALLASGRFYSPKTLLALLAAATLAPLWDYGFEVRHDNVVLTGILVIWWVIRVRQMGVISYALAGAVAVVLLFTAVKSIVYILPLSLAVLVFPPAEFKTTRIRLASAFLLGAGVTAVLVRSVYSGENWKTYMSIFGMVAKCTDPAANGTSSFAPWGTLARMLTQTPLLLGIGVAAFAATLMELVRRGRSALNWEGSLPECLLFTGSMVALAVNPTPFPYNLVNVVPYLFLLAFRYLKSLPGSFWKSTSLHPLLIGVIVFAHLSPFVTSTQRHWARLNWRQERLMALTEDLTDPKCDPVFDGIGMVLTRNPVHFQWYLHSLNIKRFLDGSLPSVSQMLSAQPAAVLIPNYRTDWLSKEDHEFIRDRYVPVGDDFWVLGKVLAAGGGTFEVYHEGRYRISTLKGSDLLDTYELGMKGAVAPEDPGTLSAVLDGKPLCNRPVQLTVGTHRIECSTNCQPAVVWVGPHLDRIHRIGPGDHRTLFVNWY